MAALEPVECLRQVPLFSDLSDANLERVVAIARTEVFPRHSHLSDAGQPGRAFYYIVSGEALVRAIGTGGRLRPVAYLHAGDYLGVTSLLLGEPHDATVEATTDLVALVVPRADFARLRQEDPLLDEELLPPEGILPKLRRERAPWLQPGEVVVFFGRRHWFVLLRRMLVPTLGALLLAALLLALLGGPRPGSWYVPVIVSLAVYLPILAWHLVDWRNDHFIATTERVVHRELILYTHESRHEAPLNRIQDVTVKRDFWGNLLGYGDVLIETAAHSGLGRIVFDYLPDPDAAKNVIFQQLFREQARAQSLASETVQRELKRRLGWATVEELEAQREDRIAPANGQPTQARGGWRSHLPALRLLPPLREVEGDRITWRKHWIFLLRRISTPLLAAFVWFLLLFAYLRGSLFPQPTLNTGVLLGLLVGGLAIAFWLWWQAVDWENDVYILTDDRIIDIEKKPLFFAEDRREATLDRIQNVNLVVPGPLAAALRFGNVDIDTAGGEGKFTFTSVVAPHEVQREIMSRVARLRERQQQAESQRRRQEIADWFAIYESLRQERQGPQSSPAAPPAGTPPASS